MQRKYGFKALGPADGPVKNAIFSGNSAKMYKYDVKKASLEADRVTQIKTAYVANGAERSNLRYGYVVNG
jgi:uncharacterized protein